MELFPERLVSDLARLPGGNHAYLKQVCTPAGADLRQRLQRATERIGPAYRDRAATLLGSLDNRRFFQGFAEVAALSVLRAARWELTDLHPPVPRFELRAPSGEAVIFSVLSFLHQTRPGAEEETRRVLAEALGRVHARLRFVVLVRRWLPHDFNAEPVRRAVEMWLNRVQRQGGGDRYATFEDDHLSLEFCLSGERVKGNQSPVALVMGPHLAHRTLSVVEPRIVQELDRHNVSRFRGRPILIAGVSDQPWELTRGYLRDFLYGRASETIAGPGGASERFTTQAGVSLFRDPHYASAIGLLLLDRDPTDLAHVRGAAWMNPWASLHLPSGAFGLRSFTEVTPRDRQDAVTRTMHWVDLPQRVDFG